MQALLRAAGLGHLFPLMREQGASVQRLQRMQLGDFNVFFGLSLQQADNLRELAISWASKVGLLPR